MIPLWIPEAGKESAKSLAKEVGAKLLFDEDENYWIFTGSKLPAALKAYSVKPQRITAKWKEPAKIEDKTPARIHILDVPYEDRAIASKSGAKWDSKLKATTWTGGRLPEGLQPYAAPLYSYEKWFENKANKLKITPNPGSPSFSMRPHQKKGVDIALEAFKGGLPGFLLADEVGLGKTITAWMSIRQMAKVKSVLIISPLAVVPHWRSAIKMMGDGGIEVIVINYDRLQKLFEVDKESAKRIKSRKGLARFAEAREFDVVIADESHKCRNPITARSKLLAKLVAKSRFTMWLSATAGQNPLELSYLAPLLCRLTGASMADLKDFESWCRAEGLGVTRGAFGKWEWGGNQKDCEKINKLLFLPSGKRPAGGLRRRPEDIAGWPEINRILMPVELSVSERKSYQQTWSDFRKAMKMAPVGKQSQNALVAQLRLRQKMSLLRVNETIQQTLELRDNGHQVAISVAFLETLEEIKKLLEAEGQEVATIHGRLTGPEKERERMAFQKGQKPIVLFTVEEGISLHQGEHNNVPRSCIIHDLRWSAISMSQIEGRCHRDGKFAQVYWAFGNETVETGIAQIVVSRMDSMKRMIGDDTETLKKIEAILEKEATS